MLYNITVYPMVQRFGGTDEAYVCQMWGDRLEIDHRKYLDMWLLFSGQEVVSCGDVRDLHAYKRDGENVFMKYAPHI